MPLPDFLLNGYKDWIDNTFARKKNLFKKLSRGQNPKALVISCCDSRVHADKIFQADEGDFFIHRNIANIIPKYKNSSKGNETLAALEYGLGSLKIRNIIILGHSNCGGINHALNLFSNKEEYKNQSLDNWIKNIKPAYKMIDKNKSGKEQLNSLEKMNIINSISNLEKIPIVNKLNSKKQLNIYGLWFEIKSGKIMILNREKKIFENFSYL